MKPVVSLLILLVSCVAGARSPGQGMAEALGRVQEFVYLREIAENMGVRAWLFGGTAAGFGHYVRWDDGSPRFDYDFTNIYRSTQDLDIVVDGTAAQAAKVEKLLKEKFNHVVGSKTAWEVRLLRESRGDKDALLANEDFLGQHTDSNSTGMIEVTVPPAGETIVRDLRDWHSARPIFLTDLEAGKLHYYFSPTHEKTRRAREGLNPPILSVIRYLTKAFQYQLEVRPADFEKIRAIVKRFDGHPANPYVVSWIEKNGKKLLQHAVDVEYAVKTLDELGLREKLAGNPLVVDSLAWWMRKEPLRSKPLGASGKSARELGIDVVAHETRDYLAYEAITRSTKNIPNVLISRAGIEGETAAWGDGFYTRRGREGAKGTGFTIRFRVSPNAREGADFTVHDDYVIFKNRSALTIVPESLHLGPVEYFSLLRDAEGFDHSDRGILERLRRRVGNKLGALGPADRERIVHVLVDDGIKNARQMIAVQDWLATASALTSPETVTLLRELTRMKDWRAPLVASLVYLSKRWEPVLLADPVLKNAFRFEWLETLIHYIEDTEERPEKPFFDGLDFETNIADNPFIRKRTEENPEEALGTLLHLLRHQSKRGGYSPYLHAEGRAIAVLTDAVEGVAADPAVMARLTPLVDKAMAAREHVVDAVEFVLSSPVFAANPCLEEWLSGVMTDYGNRGTEWLVRMLLNPTTLAHPAWGRLVRQALSLGREDFYYLLGDERAIAHPEWKRIVEEVTASGKHDDHIRHLIRKLGTARPDTVRRLSLALFVNLKARKELLESKAACASALEAK